MIAQYFKRLQRVMTRLRSPDRQTPNPWRDHPPVPSRAARYRLARSRILTSPHLPSRWYEEASRTSLAPLSWADRHRHDAQRQVTAETYPPRHDNDRDQMHTLSRHDEPFSRWETHRPIDDHGAMYDARHDDPFARHGTSWHDTSFHGSPYHDGSSFDALSRHTSSFDSLSSHTSSFDSLSNHTSSWDTTFQDTTNHFEHHYYNSSAWDSHA